MEKKQELEIKKVYENPKKREPLIIYQKLSDYEEKSKHVDLLETLKSNTKDLTNMSKKQVDTLMSNVNTHLILKKNENNEIEINTSSITESLDIANSIINNSENSCDPKEIDIKSPFQMASGLGLTPYISIQSMEELTAYNRNGELTTIKPFISEVGQSEVMSFIDRGQSYEQIAKELLTLKPEIKMIDADYTESKKVHIPLIGEIAEPDVQVSNEFMNDLSFIISANNEFEGLIDEQSLYNRVFRGSMMVNERKLNLIEKPFYEEKFIPTEQEFKDEAKSIKSNYSNLGTAQNELAKIYGFKDYRAIKPCFPKSNDEIAIFMVNTFKLNENENEELNNLYWKFRVIFRRLNIGLGLLNQFNAFENIHPRLYSKDTKRLFIQENSLMQIYSYFLTENSIIFGQIKRNIQKLSQDEKTNILKDLESLEIDKKDETVFGLFVGLLEYHIGKSAGDVTLIKNEDGSIGKIFKPKSDVDTKVENAVNEILNRNRMQISSDSSSIKVSQKDLQDALNISQSDERINRLRNQNEKMFKKFGFEFKEDEK